MPEKPWKHWTRDGTGWSSGQGDVGPVVHADGRRGVLKHSQKRFENDAKARRRLSTEVHSLQIALNAGIKVPKVLDSNMASFDDHNTLLFFVMERIEGPTLAKFIEERRSENTPPLTIAAAIPMILDLCSSMKMVHEEDILHRDLKPDNLIVRSAEPPDLVLLDFGLAYIVGTDGPTTLDDKFRKKFLTLPERVATYGNSRDPRSDITDLVGLLFFCLTGNEPELLLDGNSLPPHRRQIANVLHSSIQKVETRLYLNGIFERGFKNNVEDRFQTIGDLEVLLQDLMTGKVNRMDDMLKQLQQESEQYQRESRRVQLAEMVKKLFDVVGVQWSTINQEIGEINTKLQQQRMHFSVNSGYLDTPPLPNNYEEPDKPHGFFFKVIAKEYEKWRVVVYKVGVMPASSTCTILRYIGTGSPREGNLVGNPIEPWTPIANLNFSGDSGPNHDALKAEIQKSILASAQALRQEARSAS